MPAVTYFFAYGERMSAEKMQADAPGARAVGPARLDGYRLAFNVASRSWGGGAANALADPRGHLWGVLWELDDQAFGSIDSFRGEEPSRLVLDVIVDGPDGEVPARTYAVDSPERFIQPGDRYVAMLRAVATDQGLPKDALDAIEAAGSGPPGSAPSI
jgi:AIG2-like family